MRLSRLKLLFITFFLVACSSQSDRPARVVESYYQALINKNENQMLSFVCSQWESQARNDYQSFAAVTAELKDLQCSVKEFSENSASVVCRGLIIANYGNEILEIDLSRFNFDLIQEAGDWRLCGYR